MSLNLNGIIVAVPTPFNSDGEVAHDKLIHNLEQWNRTDLLGYLILGSTGEFPHLSEAEKLAVVETVRGAIPPEKVLLVGTGELSTRQTLESTRLAAERGADGAVVVTPFYYKKVLEEEHRAEHYRRVADRAQIPVLIYLIPQFAGVYLLPETIAALAEHPNIIGLKESSGDLQALKDTFRHLGGREFNVLVGAPPIFHEALEAGAAGAVFAVAALAPRACLAVEQAWRRGETERAARLQDRLAALARKTTAAGVGHLKAALDMVGLYGYLPRSPLPAPTAGERAEIEQALAESGFFTRAGDGQWLENEYFDFEYAD